METRAKQMYTMPNVACNFNCTMYWMLTDEGDGIERFSLSHGHCVWCPKMSRLRNVMIKDRFAVVEWF